MSQRRIQQRALIYGLNYPLDPVARLNGCCNDARNMARYLTSNQGFRPAQIDLVTDEDMRNATRCSRDGMIDALYNLCISSWKDGLDRVVFHYSGHGSQTLDLNAEEADGQDEGICPMDFNIRGLIVDDLLLSIFLKFNPKTKIVCIFDCCHSGSILDLQYAYDARKLVDNGARVRKPIVGPIPQIICISGCKDDQTSADSADDTGAGAGAMTAAILRLLSARKQQPYPVLQFQEDLAKQLTTRGYSQRPILSSSIPLLSSTMLFA